MINLDKKKTKQNKQIRYCTKYFTNSWWLRQEDDQLNLKWNKDNIFLLEKNNKRACGVPSVLLLLIYDLFLW